VNLGRYEDAGNELQTGLDLRGPDPIRLSISRRLADSATPLNQDARTSAVSDSEAFYLSARVLERRGDLDGALYAAQLGAQADPTSQTNWLLVMRIAQPLGRTDI